MTPERRMGEGMGSETPEDSRMGEILQDLREEYWKSLEGSREVQTREILQYVAFSLSGQTYAVPISHVREVTLMPGLSRLPRSPEHIAGVINLRGRILPVIDLRPLLGVREREMRREFRLLFAEAKSQVVGLVVERILGIIEIEPADLRLRSAGERAEEDPHLAGQVEIEDRIIMILDTESLIEDEAARLRGDGS